MGGIHVVFRQRGFEAGAERRGEPDRGEAGRVGGHVRGGPGGRRRGGARVVACWFLAGVHGVQGDAECLLADPGAEAPRAARQLRAPWLRQDRHDRQLRHAHAGGRREQGGGRGAAPRRWADRRLLRGAPAAGGVRVTHTLLRSPPTGV